SWSRSMIARMALAPDRDPHVSWAPDRQSPGVAASVQSISKRFKKSRVLEDISFDVAEGESLVLLGASGSGKTTILRIIAGLEQPDSGYVILHGKDVTDLPARGRWLTNRKCCCSTSHLARLMRRRACTCVERFAPCSDRCACLRFSSLTIRKKL